MPSDYIHNFDDALEPRAPTNYWVVDEVKGSGYKSVRILQDNIRITDGISGYIEEVTDRDYIISLYSPYGGEIYSVVAKTEAGTVTMLVTIQGTEVTGSTLNVTTTKGTALATAANVFAKGDTLSIRLSASAGGVAGLDFSIIFDRKIV